MVTEYAIDRKDYNTYRDGDFSTHPYAPTNTPINNYQYSSIREWLNSSFLQQARLESIHDYNNNAIIANPLLTSTIDNASQTIGELIYPSYILRDKVFLLSYNEAMNSKYFSNEVVRHSIATDYTKVKAPWIETNLDYFGVSTWWLRTPSGATKAYRIAPPRYDIDYSIDHNGFTIRPAILQGNSGQLLVCEYLAI